VCAGLEDNDQVVVSRRTAWLGHQRKQGCSVYYLIFQLSQVRFLIYFFSVYWSVGVSSCHLPQAFQFLLYFAFRPSSSCFCLVYLVVCLLVGCSVLSAFSSSSFLTFPLPCWLCLLQSLFLAALVLFLWFVLLLSLFSLS